MNQTESRVTLCNSCQNTNDLGRLRAEIELLRVLCAEWLLFGVNVMPSDAIGYEGLDGLRNRTCAAIAAGRGEG